MFPFYKKSGLLVLVFIIIVTALAHFSLQMSTVYGTFIIAFYILLAVA